MNHPNHKSLRITVSSGSRRANRYELGGLSLCLVCIPSLSADLLVHLSNRAPRFPEQPGLLPATLLHSPVAACSAAIRHK